jgi:ketol-acid reductoisomerase
MANELVKLAKSMTAATKDLAEIREIMPAMKEKQKELYERREEATREMNRLWDDATRDVETKTIELTEAISKELVAYFKGSGKGVRTADNTGSLVEVFIGSEDGVNRQNSKVGVHIALTVGTERANFMLRNESLDDISGELSDKGTIQKLLQEVKKADKRGFWNEPEME